MNRVTFTVVGYVMLTLGFLSIILSLIGLRLVPISFIDEFFSPVVSLLIKLSLIVGGIIIFYISRVNPDQEDE